MSQLTEQSNEFLSLALLYERNTLARRICHILVVANFFAVIGAITLGVSLWLLFSDQEQYVYFVTDNQGKVLTETPVSVPLYSNKEVLDFAVSATETATSYDHLNYRAELSKIREYFSDFAAKNYMNALEESNNMRTILQEKMILSGKVTGQPTQFSTRNIGENFVWDMSLPIKIDYLSQKRGFEQQLNAQVTVARVPRSRASSGIQVVQFILSPRGSAN